MSDQDKYICKRCGEKYDWREQEPPEDATFYWVPVCPACNAKMTANTVSQSWLNIISQDIFETEDPEYYLKKAHYHARLYHGRMAGLSVSELVELAQSFDEKADIGGPRYGPKQERNVAFNLRKQARKLEAQNN